MISPIHINNIVTQGYTSHALSCENSSKQNITLNVKNNFELFDLQKSNLNKSLISFKGYYGDQQPLKKLFWISTGRNDVYEDNWAKSHLYQVGRKKWINARPSELLRLTPERTIQSLCTIIKPENQYPGIPPYIPSPDFGDK